MPVGPFRDAQDSGGNHASAGGEARGSRNRLADVMVDGVTAFFRSADERIGQRLANSHTSVLFHITDAEPLTFTLRLDRVPIEADAGEHGDPEVVVYGTADALSRVFLGRDHMALMIARRELEFEGPVRKVLRAVPIMRQLDVECLKELAAEWRKSTGGQAPQTASSAAAPTEVKE
jgi:hypothetical protein